MKMNNPDDDLDDCFAAARTNATAPAPEALLTRIIGDAEAELKVRQKPRANLAQVFAGFGGWMGFGGLVVATLAGVWIGVSVPADIAVDSFSVFADVPEDALTLLLPGYD